MNARTIRSFNVPVDIWKIVENWAKTENFTSDESKQDRRKWHKSGGVLNSKINVEVLKDGDAYRLEAWLEPSLLTRIITIFAASREMALESGGYVLVLQRTEARDAVNRLLIDLGQPLIQ